MGWEDAVAQASSVGLQIDYKKYVVILLKNYDVTDENEIYAAVLEIIEQNSLVEGYGVHLIDDNRNLFVLFGDSEGELWEVINVFQEVLKQHTPKYIMAVSNFHTDFTQGSMAYIEADVAFDNRLFSDSRIVRFSELEQKDYINPISDNLLRRLVHAIHMKDKSAVERVAKEICDGLNDTRASLYAFKIVYHKIVTVLLNEWKDDKVGFEEFFNMFTMSQCGNREDFYNLICRICDMIIDNADDISEESDLVRRALVYMQENFHSADLNMNAVAEYLGVSSAKLSKEFKKQVDVRPLDYLTSLRMERAKLLLRETNDAVQDIGQAVGYEDVHIFIDRFKKYTGTTPKRYREECVNPSVLN